MIPEIVFILLMIFVSVCMWFKEPQYKKDGKTIKGYYFTLIERIATFAIFVTITVDMAVIVHQNSNSNYLILPFIILFGSLGWVAGLLATIDILIEGCLDCPRR